MQHYGSCVYCGKPVTEEEKRFHNRVILCKECARALRDPPLGKRDSIYMGILEVSLVFLTLLVLYLILSQRG